MGGAASDSAKFNSPRRNAHYRRLADRGREEDYCCGQEGEEVSAEYTEASRRYSGTGRSGVCKCGHSWEEHHLGVVMNRDFWVATGESYVPQECEFYGFNEVGGKQFKDGKWLEHCYGYRDSLLGDK